MRRKRENDSWFFLFFFCSVCISHTELKTPSILFKETFKHVSHKSSSHVHTTHTSTMQHNTWPIRIFSFASYVWDFHPFQKSVFALSPLMLSGWWRWREEAKKTNPSVINMDTRQTVFFLFDSEFSVHGYYELLIFFSLKLFTREIYCGIHFFSCNKFILANNKQVHTHKNTVWQCALLLFRWSSVCQLHDTHSVKMCKTLFDTAKPFSLARSLARSFFHFTHYARFHWRSLTRSFA